MVDHVGKVWMPGDVLSGLQESEKTGKVILGPGLRQEEENVFVSKVGILRFKDPNVYWIDSHQKRYVPVRGDTVIGVVTTKGGDVFRVDVGGSELASLSFLSFEGATKRNRPDVKVGDLVYSTFLLANKDMEPELVCIDSGGRSSGLGVIGRNGGFLYTCSLNLIRKILSPECPLLKLMERTMPFEITVGMNGRLWVKGRTVRQTIAILNAITASEYMSVPQITTMCKRLGDFASEKE